MTVGVSVKVHDGLVFAADSATTFTWDIPNGPTQTRQIQQVYNHADKIFHLHRHAAIAAMTWGLANLGPASVATVAKDLRRALMADPSGGGLDLSTYTVEEVATALGAHFQSRYATEYAGDPDPPYLGFLVGGYSAGSDQAETWLVEVSDPSTAKPPTQEQAVGSYGWNAYASNIAIFRLINGYCPELLQPALSSLLQPAEVTAVMNALLGGAVQLSPVQSSMPFPDAIELARYFVDVTKGFAHFLPGADTVGGAVDLAAITRHEGFKWVGRKHYYPSDLNPEDPHAPF